MSYSKDVREFNNATPEEQEAALNFSNEISKLPEEEQGFMPDLILDSFVKCGATWTFVGEKDPISKMLDKVEDNENVNCIHVGLGSTSKSNKGYLIDVNGDYLMDISRKAVGVFLEAKDLVDAEKRRVLSLGKLDKFLKDHYNEGQVHQIGIYSLNTDSRVAIDGIQYPAFCVNLTDLAIACAKNGWTFVLGGEMRYINETMNHYVKVLERLAVSPSKNALLIEIAPNV